MLYHSHFFSSSKHSAGTHPHSGLHRSVPATSPNL